jgi:hypothetical protein
VVDVEALTRIVAVGEVALQAGAGRQLEGPEVGQAML